MVMIAVQSSHHKKDEETMEQITNIKVVNICEYFFITFHYSRDMMGCQ